MPKTENTAIKTAILMSALPDVPFDGWTDAVLVQAAKQAGYEAAMMRSVFPAGVRDAIIYFSQWADAEMLKTLQQSDFASLKVREKITRAVRTRLEVLAPHKEAERLAIAYWVRPFRKWDGIRLVWKTADVIWDWAGDTATDYNRYTKRGLLSGVLTSTILFWLADMSDNTESTWAFLDRRIEDVMRIGKIVGQRKSA